MSVSVKHGNESKEPYAPPKVLATYGKDELDTLIRPHGYSGGGCGCGCG